MVAVSVCVITFNEEHNLPACLESIQSIADEVIVVDSHSQDRTREIAEEHGGTLELDPEFKAGARFQLRVPLGREGDPGDTDTPRVPDSKPPSPGEFDE